MKKKRLSPAVNITLSVEALEMIEILVDKQNRTRSNLLDYLVKKEFKETVGELPDEKK